MSITAGHVSRGVQIFVGVLLKLSPSTLVFLVFVVVKMAGLDLLAALLALHPLRLTLGVESEDVARQVTGASLDLDPADVTRYKLSSLVDVLDVQHQVTLVGGGVGTPIAAVHLLIRVVDAINVDLEAILVSDHLPTLITGYSFTCPFF